MGVVGTATGATIADRIAARIPQGYGEKKPGEVHSRLEKLVRGMPKRLHQCKEHNYGRCGK